LLSHNFFNYMVLLWCSTKFILFYIFFITFIVANPYLLCKELNWKSSPDKGHWYMREIWSTKPHGYCLWSLFSTYPCSLSWP
jgi:hypothetical protein